MGGFYTVITTIQTPTDGVLKFAERLTRYSGKLLIVGDKKGPVEYPIHLDGKNGVRFLSFQKQLDGPFKLARELPVGHYSRKNIGYLHAIAHGASCIYETDDDNAPLAGWQPRKEYVEDTRVIESSNTPEKNSRWVNVYKYFVNELIWPRGLPLDEIHQAVPVTKIETGRRWSPIQQGLVNESPDVDAIWHLVLAHTVNFEENSSVYLEPDNWCPFNTQSTWWWPAAFPLLYIPSFCSFRMCDIWRSFVAQKCIWEMDGGITFHPPEVVQKRNTHNLMSDFRDEIPGYDRNGDFIKILDNVNLLSGIGNTAANLRTCYEVLVRAGFFPEDEFHLLDSWILDFEKFGKNC